MTQAHYDRLVHLLEESLQAKKEQIERICKILEDLERPGGPDAVTALMAIRKIVEPDM